jgi:putative DNA primase/helicase
MNKPEEILCELLSQSPQTDLGNAERFVKRSEGNLIFCPGIGWHFWDDSRWSLDVGDVQAKLAAQHVARSIQDEASIVEKRAREVPLDMNTLPEYRDLGKNQKLQCARELRWWGTKSESIHRIWAMMRLAAPHLGVAPEQLDIDAFKINLRNGTLDVPRCGDSKRIVFRPHDRRDLITKVCPVDYDPAAVCPTYDSFIAEAQPFEQVRRFLHQWVGLSLTGDAREQRFVYFWGKGANGRTLLLRLCGYVAGDYAKLVPIETFCDGRRRAGAATLISPCSPGRASFIPNRQKGAGFPRI